MLFPQHVELALVCVNFDDFSSKLRVNQLVCEHSITLIPDMNQPQFFFLKASSYEAIFR